MDVLDGELPFVTLARPATCDVCASSLETRARARLVGRARVRCVACFDAGSSPPATPAAALALAPSLAVPDARWIASAAIASCVLALRSRRVRRLFKTVGVALKGASRLAWNRARGKRGTAPAIVRSACEELGPTYVKLGQLVASTQGIFPEPYCLELRGCLDRVRPVSFEAIERIVVRELGAPLATTFSEIDPAPLASASIAQVHAARLRDGSDVVLKVQRPGIADSIAADVALLGGVARLIELSPRGKLASPRAIVEDFAQTLSEELDFTREAESMAEFNRAMKDLDRDDVVAPRVVRATKRLIVMERFYGSRVDEVAVETHSPEEIEEKLVLGMRAWFQCVVFHGFFHGDVHAGNLMALTDGRIGFLDWGIVGRLSRTQRQGVVDTLLCFAAGDFAKLARVWRSMGSVDGGVDIDALGRDLSEVYAPLLKAPLEALKFADILPALIKAAEKHRLKLPRDFVLVTKQMLYFDRYARKLAPRLNVFNDPRLVTPLAVDILCAGMLPA